MAYYGYKITTAGRNFLARLLAGETMEISRVAVGSGQLADGEELEDRTDLVETVAMATSLEPVVEGNQMSLMIEYRSDLNGGLDEGFNLNEFGIFVIDDQSETGETLLLYATLGEHPQYVAAYTGNTVDIRRFPVTIVIGEDRNVVVSYRTEAWMTQEDVRNYYSLVLLPLVKEEIDEKISIHNRDTLAHHDIRDETRMLDSKVKNLEVGLRNNVLSNMFSITFHTLDKVELVAGIWNRNTDTIDF